MEYVPSVTNARHIDGQGSCNENINSAGCIKAGFSRDGSSAAGAMQRSWSYFCSTAPGRLADNRCKNSARKVQKSGTPMVQKMSPMRLISGPENLFRKWPRFGGRLYEFQQHGPKMETTNRTWIQGRFLFDFCNLPSIIVPSVREAPRQADCRNPHGDEAGCELAAHIMAFSRPHFQPPDDVKPRRHVSVQKQRNMQPPGLHERCYGD